MTGENIGKVILITLIGFVLALMGSGVVKVIIWMFS